MGISKPMFFVFANMLENNPYLGSALCLFESIYICMYLSHFFQKNGCSIKNLVFKIECMCNIGHPKHASVIF